MKAQGKSMSDLPSAVTPRLPPELGAKGARARRRIMDATATMLDAHPFLNIRVTDIARAAGMAQPNFYTYFSSVEDVVEALAEEVSLDALVPLVEPEWSGEEGLALARRLVEAWFTIWGRHGALFTAINILADKLHGEFPAIRVRHVRGLYKAFEAKVRAGQAAGAIGLDIQPRLAGYECIGLLGSIGSRRLLFLDSGFSLEDIVDTTARLLYSLTTGSMSPGPGPLPTGPERPPQ